MDIPQQEQCGSGEELSPCLAETRANSWEDDAPVPVIGRPDVIPDKNSSQSRSEYAQYFDRVAIDNHWRDEDKACLFKIYKKIDKYSEVISYFSIRSWRFGNDNVKSLWMRMPEKDRNNFNFDISSLDWNKFFYNYIRGLRVYLLKDEMDTLPQATIRWKRFQMAHRILKIFFSLTGIYLTWLIAKLFYTSIIG